MAAKERVMRYSKEDLQRKLKSELVRIAGQELRIFTGKRDRRGNLITNQSAYAASIPHEELVKDILTWQAKQEGRGGYGTPEQGGGRGEGKPEGKAEGQPEQSEQGEGQGSEQGEGDEGEGQDGESESESGESESEGSESEGQSQQSSQDGEGQQDGEKSDAGATLWGIIKPHAYEDIQADLERLNRDAIKKELSRIIPRTSTVKLVDPSGDYTKVERVHKLFPKLVRYTMKNPDTGTRLNVMLVGPAGGFKSSAAYQLAQALKVKFYQISIGPQTSESRLVGFTDAYGKEVITQVREAYTNGGVLCIDEIDAGNAGVLTCMNSILANGIAAFLGLMIERHPDLIVVGTSNTFGRGADRVYVGRQALDGATLDRWVQITWDYDEELEKALWVKTQPHLRWFDFVTRVRAAVFTLGLRVIVGPRCTQQGTHLLNCGVEWADVEQDVVWNRFSTDDRQKVEQYLRENRKSA
jgi:hypothetical protein